MDITLSQAVMVATLLLNFAGLVWGAAKMSSGLSDLKIALQEVKSTVGTVVRELAELRVEYNARIMVLEDRYERIGNK